MAAAVRTLKGHAERKEEVVFARRGYEGVREFFGAFLRLSGVAVVGNPLGSGAAVQTTGEGALWLNPEARHPLPREVVTALAQRLAGQ